MNTLLSITILASLAMAAPQAPSADRHACPMNDTTHAQASAADPSALTADQVQQLLSGEGMGQAKPAELSGYPGPKHVMDMADALKLTPEQRAAAATIFDRMNAEAKKLGAEIVQAERDLYAAFDSHTVKADDIEEMTMRIAHLQGELRAHHLRAHIETAAISAGLRSSVSSRTRRGTMTTSQASTAIAVPT